MTLAYSDLPFEELQSLLDNAGGSAVLHYLGCNAQTDGKNPALRAHVYRLIDEGVCDDWVVVIANGLRFEALYMEGEEGFYQELDTFGIFMSEFVKNEPIIYTGGR